MVSTSRVTRDDGIVRVAAIGDVHCAPASRGSLQSVLNQIAQTADVLVICGDLTNHGLPEEAHALVEEFSSLSSLPVLAVLGNHDYEAGQVDELRRIVSGAGIHLLDGDSFEHRGIGFVGVKGFCGGFDRGILSAFGEPAVKNFVQETIDEVHKLESALARTKAEKKIAILHYSPIRTTVEGEPEEIFPFLGSGRLEEPLNRYQVAAVVHGHAHRGAPEGKTKTGIPVYNVAVPVMRTAYPNRPPFRLLDVHVAPTNGKAAKPLEAPVESDIA
ncbi:MAG TPA: metallophosphoesterase [Tepidisphaeraceae bacterium]|jgi:Icc-related predicted phosphoesterase